MGFAPSLFDGVLELGDQWGGSSDGNRLIGRLERLLEGSLAEDVLNVLRYGDLHMPLLTALYEVVWHRFTIPLYPKLYPVWER